MHLLRRSFQVTDLDSCLRLFDANSPLYFAPNERTDYLQFLSRLPAGYDVYLEQGIVVGGCGLSLESGSERARLSWILVDPGYQGRGLGVMMVRNVIVQARAVDATVIDIAASRHSARFFERFGAEVTAQSADGWGPGMDRVDMTLTLGR